MLFHHPSPGHGPLITEGIVHARVSEGSASGHPPEKRAGRPFYGLPGVGEGAEQLILRSHKGEKNGRDCLMSERNLKNSRYNRQDHDKVYGYLEQVVLHL